MRAQLFFKSDEDVYCETAIKVDKDESFITFFDTDDNSVTVAKTELADFIKELQRIQNEITGGRL